MRSIRLALAALLTCVAQGAIAGPPPVKPKLVVVISVDQFSSEVFRRYRSGYTGGLKTLSDGIAFPVAYQSHAATETCPGHSTLMTGRHPAATGIVANSWYDAKTGKSVYCVSVPGDPDPDARGPQNMHVTTLGDWVKAAELGARSYAVSGKDRAAITMGGKHADGVWWWLDGTGFVTARQAGPATPATEGPAQTFDAALRDRWTKAPPSLWPQPAAGCAALQVAHRFGGIDLSGRVPPNAAASAEAAPGFLASKDFQANLRASPLFDSTVVDFAQALIARERLGHGPATDVLAVSLSANDYIGHRYGNGGAEMCVQQTALDASIGRLMATIRALGVPVMVVLTADHGATDAAEREHEHDPAAARLDSHAFVTRLNAAVAAQTGGGIDPIVGDDPEQLYIRTVDPVLRRKVGDAATTWLRAQPEVRAVFTRDAVARATVPRGTTPDRLTIVQRYHESYDPERSGDIAVAYAPRTSFGVPHKTGDVVAGHGSPWDHDRQVPILFWWEGAQPATRTTPIETVDIAPTLAGLARMKTPKVDGRCIDLGGMTCRR